MTKFYSVKAVRTISYDLIKSANLLSHRNKTLLINRVNKNGGKCFVAVDNSLYDSLLTEIQSYYEFHKIEVKIISVQGLEIHKTLESVEKVLYEINTFGINRRTEPVVVIGGGVVMDVVGMACSLYRRGVPCIKVPTTVMGYIDAGIGIKTGVDFQNSKNRLGTFEPPSAVILDRGFLETLDNRHVINGVGEAIKVAVINNEKLFRDLQLNGKNAVLDHFQEIGDTILDESILGLITDLETNLFEIELKRDSDFGHTFSPCIEMMLQGELLHGECVAIDIAISAVIARKRKLINQFRLDEIINLITSIGLPKFHRNITPELLLEGVAERTLHRGGNQNIPLPTQNFISEFVQDVSLDDINHAVKYLR